MHTKLPALKKIFYSLTCLTILLAFPNKASAQLTVNPGVTAASLISSLIGQGVTVNNVVINCPTNAYGTFSNGASTNMGISNGIIMTSGSAVNAIGPNNSTSSGTCNGTIANDPDLQSLEPLATNDPCIIEFDIVPSCTNLQIRFVFGSEEYPEFVSSGFNDAFGFFVTGPGPACQPNFYNNTNVATLPDNTTIVSIDNINAGNNNTFYVDNTGGSTIQYDGFTTVLTRNVSLCPCATYHWKLAIADAGDCIYDSGVFVDFIACSNALTITPTQTNSDCSGCNGTAALNTSGGIGPISYVWSPNPSTGQGTNAAGGLCPGTYTCTVTDNGLPCSASQTQTFTIINSGTLTVSGTSTAASCSANDG
ncbi:MAG TPA: choice-of-anchor L domain-containing protein, partial [Bacteroidia bacterium]|nr:choice-of-anchor L domain-containing protein [Bacteroidia bacterium]